MRFYKNPNHRFYAGIDLHARTVRVCILDHQDDIVVHKNLRADPTLFLQTIKPYRSGGVAHGFAAALLSLGEGVRRRNHARF